jgi:uncharacterized membrane protein (UPF0127 family)
LVAIALLPAGCATDAPPESVPATTPGASWAATLQTPGIGADDWARVGEVWQLIAEEGPGIWAGWGEELLPLLVESETDDYVVGHPGSPEGFHAVDGLTVRDRQVLTRAGHLVPGIGVQELDGVYGVALLPRERLQVLIDDSLGPGVVALDDVQYVRWTTHEAFHVHEINLMGGELPRFGYGGNDMEMVAELSRLDGLEKALAEEGRLLLEALLAPTEEAARAEIDDFLAVRAARRASLDPEVTGFEQAVEWAEGLARYSDVRLLQAAGTDYAPSKDFARLGASYPKAAATWSDAIHWLSDLSAVPGTLRDQYYELGAAQAYLLDRLMPGWQVRALPGGESLEELLEAGEAAAELGIPVTLRVLQTASLGIADHTLTVAIADQPAAWGRGLAGIDDLGPLDGLLFAFPEPVEAAFIMQGALVPLDIAFFDASQECIYRTTMPICSDDPCPTYAAPGPYTRALEAPAGSLAGIAIGDELDLEVR